MFNNLKKKFEERGIPLRSTCPSDSEPKRRTRKLEHSDRNLDRNLIAFDNESAEWASKCRTLQDKLEKQEADFAWEIHWKNEQLEKSREERRTLARELKRVEQQLNTAPIQRGDHISGASGDFLKSVFPKSELETCEENENLRRELKRLIEDNSQLKNGNEKLKAELKQAKEELKMAEELNEEFRGDSSWELKFIELQKISNFESKSLQAQLQQLGQKMNEVKKFEKELKEKDFMLKAARENNEDLHAQIEYFKGRESSTLEESEDEELQIQPKELNNKIETEDNNQKKLIKIEKMKIDNKNVNDCIESDSDDSDGEIVHLDQDGYGTARCYTSPNSDEEFFSCDNPENLKSVENNGRIWRRTENSYIKQGDAKKISKMKLKKTSTIPKDKSTGTQAGCFISIEDVEESSENCKNVPSLIHYYSKLDAKIHKSTNCFNCK